MRLLLLLASLVTAQPSTVYRYPVQYSNGTVSCPACITALAPFGVSSLAASSPIVVSGSTGAITVSCPTCGASADSSRVSGLSDSAKALVRYARTTAIHDTTDTLRAYARARIHDSLNVLTPGRIGALSVTSSPVTAANFGDATTAYSQAVSANDRGLAMQDSRALNWRGGMFCTDTYWGFSQDASLSSSFKPFVLADGTGSVWFKNDPLATIKNTLNGGTSITGTVNLPSVTASRILKTDSNHNVVAAVTSDFPIDTLRARAIVHDSLAANSRGWVASSGHVDSARAAGLSDSAKALPRYLRRAKDTLLTRLVVLDTIGGDGGKLDFNISRTWPYGGPRLHGFGSASTYTGLILKSVDASGTADSRPAYMYADAFVKNSGTSAQYLMADGSTSAGGTTGSGTANAMAVWTGSGTLGTGSWTDSTSVSRTTTTNTLVAASVRSNGAVTAGAESHFSNGAYTDPDYTVGRDAKFGNLGIATTSLKTGPLFGTSAAFTVLNAGGIIKANTSGTLAIAGPGSDYLRPPAKSWNPAQTLTTTPTSILLPTASVFTIPANSLTAGDEIDIEMSCPSYYGTVGHSAFIYINGTATSIGASYPVASGNEATWQIAKIYVGDTGASGYLYYSIFSNAISVSTGTVTGYTFAGAVYSINTTTDLVFDIRAYTPSGTTDVNSVFAKMSRY